MKSSVCIARMPIKLPAASCQRNRALSCALIISFKLVNSWLTLLYHEQGTSFNPWIYVFSFHTFDSGHPLGNGLRNTSFSNIPPCRNAEVKSRISTSHSLTVTINITRCIASWLHVGESVYANLLPNYMWQGRPFIIFLLPFNFFVITHLVDIHSWLV